MNGSLTRSVWFECSQHRGRSGSGIPGPSKASCGASLACLVRLSRTPNPGPEPRRRPRSKARPIRIRTLWLRNSFYVMKNLRKVVPPFAGDPA